MQMGDTAFIWAAMKAHSDTADLLLKHGAQVNFQNEVMWGEGWQGKGESEDEGEGEGADEGEGGECAPARGQRPSRRRYELGHGSRSH